MSNEQPKQDCPVKESYRDLFETFSSVGLPATELVRLKIQVKINWELSKTLEGFDRATGKLGRVNIAVTVFIAIATAAHVVVTWVEVASK